jgi:hypothetical protein
MVEQGYPDREMMEMWVGSYKTRNYPASAFSDREWESPAKQRRLQALQERANAGSSPILR